MRASDVILGLLCVVTAGALVACRPEPEPSREPMVYSGLGASVAAGFGRSVPVAVDARPSLPAYDFDLGRVANAGQLEALGPELRAALEENGFVVTPGTAAQIYDAYQQAEEAGWPIFVTTDALLHTHHVLYDYALRLAEVNSLIGEAEGLTLALLQAAIAQAEAAEGERVRDAALRNVAFFDVAARLLDLDTPRVPAEAKKLADAELTLIAAHDGVAESPLLARPDLEAIGPSTVAEDYSQYVPRGHYTRSEDLERYFRAMMWYGRIGLRLKPGDAPDAVELGRRQTRQAILIVAALYNTQATNPRTGASEAALDAWSRIYEPTAFFVGQADDLVAADYAPLIAEVYGQPFDPAALEDDGALDGFIARAMELRPPRILSGMVLDTELDPTGGGKVEDVTRGLHFMSQRFIPDSYIFQQLVYDKVLAFQGEGQPFTWKMTPRGALRTMPRGLDIPAVLGSERALAILAAEGDAAYDRYEAQMGKLRAEFAALPDEQWVANLYWNWLHSLRPLLAAKGEGYPSFMQTAAWADKDLNAFLGSWAELRHDTILYAKQSYTVVGGSAPLPVEPTAGYVEPQPEVYARLAALTRQMIDGLGSRDLLPDEYRGNLEGMESLLLDLKTIAEKELRGEALTEAEGDRIRYIGHALEDIVTLSVQNEDEITSETDERMAIVADVHTDLNEPAEVLEEGVGDAFPIYVLVPAGDRLLLATGAVLSYYELKQPLDRRLTDEAWQALAPRPARPPWTASFER